MSSPTPTARDGALAKLAAEAARFERPSAEAQRSPAPSLSPPPARVLSAAPAVGTHRASKTSLADLDDGYVPVAVAPERGNTRPALAVDGRLHMRVARPTLTKVDAVVRAWKDADPLTLRDLERATLVRVGLGMVLADIAQNGADGAVGEAVRAALDPAVRHTTSPMPALARWLRRSPEDSVAPFAAEVSGVDVVSPQPG